MKFSTYLYNIACKLQRLISRSSEFNNSRDYWIQRYKRGKTSGKGSYGALAEFKAEIINEFVEHNSINSVIEFGCGDGNQLTYGHYPQYLGVDISPLAVAKCKKLFSDDITKSFCLESEYNGQRADLALSLDVIYHLIEDDVFENYMGKLFNAAEMYVIIYSSNTDNNPENLSSHVQHRNFTTWIDNHKPGWKLLNLIPNRYPATVHGEDGSFADFYIYSKQSVIC